MPISNFQPIRLLDPGCWYKFSYLLTNNADPNQLASSTDLSLNVYFMYNINIFEYIQDMCLLHYNIIQWDLEESQLTYEVRLSWTDLDLHGLQKQGMSWFSRTRVNTSHSLPLELLPLDCLLPLDSFFSSDLGGLMLLESFVDSFTDSLMDSFLSSPSPLTLDPLDFCDPPEGGLSCSTITQSSIYPKYKLKLFSKKTDVSPPSWQKSCQKTTQLPGKGWSDKKTIFGSDHC